MKDTVNIGAGTVTIILPFIVGYLVYRFNPPREPKLVESNPAP